MKIDVLDHGFVRWVDSMGSDLSVVRAARVSYDADWRTNEGEKDAKLIRYLMRNHHTSPFEACTLTFEIKAPIFVIRQWHRHRTWSYNEVSARYTELPEEFYIPDAEQITTQSEDNKQMRTTEQHPGAEGWRVVYEQRMKECFFLYRAALADGVPRELARSILPLATYSRFFGTVNLHNLFHFLRLRLHPHAQYEIRVYAETLLELTEKAFPVSTAAFKETLAEQD